MVVYPPERRVAITRRLPNVASRDVQRCSTFSSIPSLCISIWVVRPGQARPVCPLQLVLEKLAAAACLLSG
jgi:hypothetical protein